VLGALALSVLSMPQKIYLGLSLADAAKPGAFVVPVLFGGLAGAGFALWRARVHAYRQDSIEVESEAGQGTEFRIHLPLARTRDVGS